jgi:hypothetical protein
MKNKTDDPNLIFGCILQIFKETQVLVTDVRGIGLQVSKFDEDIKLSQGFHILSIPFFTNFKGNSIDKFLVKKPAINEEVSKIDDNLRVVKNKSPPSLEPTKTKRVKKQDKKQKTLTQFFNSQ